MPLHCVARARHGAAHRLACAVCTPRLPATFESHTPPQPPNSTGNHVRLSGQDVERGTFSHRHAVLHDQKSGGLMPCGGSSGGWRVARVASLPLLKPSGSLPVQLASFTSTHATPLCRPHRRMIVCCLPWPPSLPLLPQARPSRLWSTCSTASGPSRWARLVCWSGAAPHLSCSCCSAAAFQGLPQQPVPAASRTLPTQAACLTPRTIPAACLSSPCPTPLCPSTACWALSWVS